MQPCDHDTSRNRTRQILRLPASPQDSPCPDLVQSEPCILNSTCFTHQYRVSGRLVCTAGCRLTSKSLCFPSACVGQCAIRCVCVCVFVDWSTCQLSENAVCGEGFRLRLLDCIRSDGKVVESWKCEQVTNAKTVRKRGVPHGRSQLQPSQIGSTSFPAPSARGSSHFPWFADQSDTQVLVECQD